MDEKRFVADFKEGDSVSKVFYVDSRNRLLTRAGKPYLSLNLRDKTGSIAAKVWEDADVIYGGMASADFVLIRGNVEKYMDSLQLKVLQLQVVRTESVDLADFLPSSAKSPDAMLEELMQIIQSLKNPFLKSLLDLIFADSEFVPRFKVSPAAKRLHHCFVGGLLEHSLSVARICDLLCEHYRNINRDLVITGAILHDLGKIYELTSSPSFDYTIEGRLVGHLALGWSFIEEKITRLEGFPKELQINLQHLILSHHGTYEYRSPVVPKTAEAMLLYQVDDLDAKVQMTQDWIEQARNEPSPFTPYHKLLERYFYKGSLDGEDA
jgi:3'-5' exoribonuclease